MMNLAREWVPYRGEYRILGMKTKEDFLLPSFLPLPPIRESREDWRSWWKKRRFLGPDIDFRPLEGHPRGHILK